MHSDQFHTKRGFATIEILFSSVLVIAFVAIITGLFAQSSRGAIDTAESRLASEFLDSGMNTVRSIADSQWNSLTYAQSGVSDSGLDFVFDGEGTTDANGVYTRTLTFADVCRDVSDSIVTCPSGTLDIQSKYLTGQVSWTSDNGAVRTLSQQTLLTNFASGNWTQTDWSGGSGQAEWADETQYDTDDGNLDISTVGEVSLASTGAGSGTWTLASGTNIVETSDTEFGAGSFTDSEVVGAGAAADIELTQTTEWFEDAESDYTGIDFNSLWVIAEDDIWAVADDGEFHRYDGTGWSEFQDIGGQDIWDIHMLSPTSGWAVGQSEKFYRWNGTTWSEEEDLGGGIIYDVFMLSESDGWAVGTSGRFYRYDGVSWTDFVDTGTTQWRGVHLTSPTSGWAVGNSGKIQEWNGTTWTEFTDVGGITFWEVVMLSPTSGFASGSSGRFYEYNGSSWTLETDTGTENWRDMTFDGASSGWAVANGGLIANWNGTTWSEFTDTGAENYFSVAHISTDDILAAGRSGELWLYSSIYETSGSFDSQVLDSGSAGTDWSTISWEETLPTGADIELQVRTGETATPDGSWSSFTAATSDTPSSISPPDGRYIQYRVTFTGATDRTQTPELASVTVSHGIPTLNNVNGISMVAEDDIWAVGNDGEFYYYDGTSWTLDTDLGAENIIDVDMVSTSDGWAVGGSGKIYQYNGTSWSEFTDTGNTVWIAIDMVSTSDGWAVGTAGKIQRWNGSTWTEFDDTGGEQWRDVFMVDASTGWMVGNGGKIQVWNGIAWIEFADTGADTWRDVHIVSPTDGWIVGGGGEILRYNGLIWSAFVDTGDENWEGLYMASASKGWIADDGSGAIREWNGTSWDVVASPVSTDLMAVDALSESNAWIVGDAGVFIELQGAGGAFESFGTLTSSAFDMGDASSVNVISWSEDLTSCTGCDITLELRTAPDDGGDPGTYTDWYGTGGSGTTFTSPEEELVSVDLNGNQWVQYRATLTGDGTTTPVLQDITVNYR